MLYAKLVKIPPQLGGIMSEDSDDPGLKEIIHRVELKHYLSADELTLPDKDREELLLQRKLVDQDALREMDLIVNREGIQDAAKRAAATRNEFTTLGSWLDSLPPGLQVILWIAGFLLISVILGILFYQ